MTENDYTIIKPVQNLSNMTGTGSVKDGRGRNKRHRSYNSSDKDPEIIEEEQNDLTSKLNQGISKNDTEEHQVDYCA